MAISIEQAPWERMRQVQARVVVKSCVQARVVVYSCAQARVVVQSCAQ